MKLQDMIKTLMKDTAKVEVTQQQLDKLEMFVVAYMAGASLQRDAPILGSKLLKDLDIAWDKLFEVNN